MWRELESGLPRFAMLRRIAWVLCWLPVWAFALLRWLVTGYDPLETIDWYNERMRP